MNKTVDVADAVGMILAHDITEIRQGEFKGRAFKKGHIVTPEDIEHLKRLGKEHLFVLDIVPGYLHENEAAVMMADAFSGDGVFWEGEPKEGKIELRTKWPGLLKVEVAALTQVNLLADIMCASRHTNTTVEKGMVVAATRAIPLVVAAQPVEKAVDIARKCGGLFRVKPFRVAKTGLIITGNEVYNHLVEDKFEAVLRKKITDIGSEVFGVAFAPDDPDKIEQEIRRFLIDGADLILTSGGMSVDPDDVTRQGIRQVGGETALYGAPVLPGAMFMLSYVNGIPILGIPACGMYHSITILDLVLPRVLAGESLTREDIAGLGHGGLCLNCKTCHYPVCPFGK
jgi:molybdenum cofactor synthesis domain-containing protein